jgi:hypothetical protein
MYTVTRISDDTILVDARIAGNEYQITLVNDKVVEVVMNGVKHCPLPASSIIRRAVAEIIEAYVKIPA